MPIFLDQLLNQSIVRPIIDYWSFVHLLTGLSFGVILTLITNKVIRKISWLISFISFIGYEIVENNYLSAVFNREPLANIFSDIFVGMLGFFVAKYVVQIYWLNRKEIKIKNKTSRIQSLLNNKHADNFKDRSYSEDQS